MFPHFSFIKFHFSLFKLGFENGLTKVRLKGLKSQEYPLIIGEVKKGHMKEGGNRLESKAIYIVIRFNTNLYW
jgi:hypothetical protein